MEGSRPRAKPDRQGATEAQRPGVAGVSHAKFSSEVRSELNAPRACFAVGDDPSLPLAEALDRSFHYFISRFTLGLSPMAIMQAYFDWLVHVAGSPGKQAQLLHSGLRSSAQLSRYVCECMVHDRFSAAPCVAPAANDKRFAGDGWQRFPFNFLHQAFLLNQQWWHSATTDIRGVSAHHARVMDFITRQALDIFSPSNYLLTNPEVLQRTQAEAGQNLVRGAFNLLEDWERSASGKPAAGIDDFKVGRDLATTSGKVVYRNRLIELIQYDPTTAQVRPEPVLFVPAWIMKFYILDLSPKKSLVRHLLDQGFTVFMVSWKNPAADDRDLGFDDYLKFGILDALDAIGSICPDQKIHGAGYCLGGTLLAIAAAAMARDGDDRFQSLTLFAAQTDFHEAGELTLFTSESQISFLEDMMQQQGYLDSAHMAGAFQMLRSGDMIWSRLIRDYLMGDRQPVFDLMAWNADTTRMPSRMHAEYLRKLFLNNDLAEGRFRVAGRAIALSDIRQPLYVVGTETDHVSPWRSVFKLNLLTDTEVTFLLTSGGHNAGIVSEPGHAGRSYRVSTKSEADRFIDPEAWVQKTPVRQGSWWSDWARWLTGKSGRLQAPPPMGGDRHQSLGDAPGSYVLQS
jgi:polyhydroxyalkanoate synthase subunit PhaC